MEKLNVRLLQEIRDKILGVPAGTYGDLDECVYLQQIRDALLGVTESVYGRHGELDACVYLQQIRNAILRQDDAGFNSFPAEVFLRQILSAIQTGESKLPAGGLGANALLSQIKGALHFYFVDATNGNDSASGTTQATAWKTIGKVNGYTFPFGSWVMFKRGGTWAGVQLTGYDGVTYGAYGSGALPIIDANNAINYAFYAVNKNYVNLQHLNLKNGLSACCGFTTSKHLDVLECSMSRGGNDNLLFYSGCEDGRVRRGSYFNTVVGANHCGIEIADNGNDFLIDGALCYQNNEGISVNNHAAPTLVPTNVVIRNCTIWNNIRNGIQIGEQGATGDLNILIENCNVNTNGNDNIQVAPIATTYPSKITIRDCISYRAVRNTYYLSGDNIRLENCVSYKGGLAACKGVKIINAVGVEIYNSTFFFEEHTGFSAIVLDGARLDNIVIKNCIQGAGQTAVFVIEVTALVAPATKNIDIDYNLYQNSAALARWKWNGTAYNWADWKTNSLQDAHSPTPADPLFVSAANKDFHLLSGSPAINAGVDVGLSFVGVAPDIGAYEKE